MTAVEGKQMYKKKAKVVKRRDTKTIIISPQERPKIVGGSMNRIHALNMRK